MNIGMPACSVVSATVKAAAVIPGVLASSTKVGDLSLTLADLGGEGEGILHALPDMARNFDTVSTRPRHERNLMAPYFTANRCDGVAEGQECFLIPGGGSRRELSRFCEVVRPQCDDGK